MWSPLENHEVQRRNSGFIFEIPLLKPGRPRLWYEQLEGALLRAKHCGTLQRKAERKNISIFRMFKFVMRVLLLLRMKENGFVDTV